MKSCCDEYCSTHGCNQGRNCPARIKPYKQMSNKKVYLIIAILLTIFWTAMIAGVFKFLQPKQKVIDCTMSEFHPDFTPKMKELCRKAQAENSHD